jgi:hypothetical protein
VEDEGLGRCENLSGIFEARECVQHIFGGGLGAWSPALEFFIFYFFWFCALVGRETAQTNRIEQFSPSTEEASRIEMNRRLEIGRQATPTCLTDSNKTLDWMSGSFWQLAPSINLCHRFYSYNPPVRSGWHTSIQRERHGRCQRSQTRLLSSTLRSLGPSVPSAKLFS